MLDVACAIIEEGSRVLAAQRARTGELALKWELPGGKVRAGESAEQCIIREIREELDLLVEVRARMPAFCHDDRMNPVRLIPFVCTVSSGTVRVLVHNRVLWLEPGELAELDWCPADLPVLHHYLEGYRSGSAAEAPDPENG
jgi:8-oxo-dGTP diphosphatase